MEELKKVFEARDSAFEKKTHEIFELIHTSLVCVTEFLNDVDSIFNAGDITWEDANLVDDLVVIVGMLEYAPGTTVKVDGNLISVTEENLDYFQRVVHMSLPFDLVASSNADDITRFLYDLHNNSNKSDFSELVEDKPSSIADFDLTKLTEEQRQSLMFYNGKEKN